MRISKIKIRKFKESLKRLFWILAEKAFLTYLILFFISLIFGAIIYYQYSAAIEKAEIEPVRDPLQFQQKTYQDILKIWQERERQLKEAGFEELADLPETDEEEFVPEEVSDSSENNREELAPEEISEFPEDSPEDSPEEENNFEEL